MLIKKVKNVLNLGRIGPPPGLNRVNTGTFKTPLTQSALSKPTRKIFRQGPQPSRPRDVCLPPLP